MREGHRKSQKEFGIWDCERKGKRYITNENKIKRNKKEGVNSVPSGFM